MLWKVLRHVYSKRERERERERDRDGRLSARKENYLRLKRMRLPAVFLLRHRDR